jgi:hypothetical protein
MSMSTTAPRPATKMRAPLRAGHVVRAGATTPVGDLPSDLARHASAADCAISALGGKAAAALPRLPQLPCTRSVVAVHRPQTTPGKVVLPPPARAVAAPSPVVRAPTLLANASPSAAPSHAANPLAPSSLAAVAALGARRPVVARFVPQAIATLVVTAAGLALAFSADTDHRLLREALLAAPLLVAFLSWKRTWSALRDAAGARALPAVPAAGRALLAHIAPNAVFQLHWRSAFGKRLAAAVPVEIRRARALAMPFAATLAFAFVCAVGALVEEATSRISPFDLRMAAILAACAAGHVGLLYQASIARVAEHLTSTRASTIP